MTLLPIFTEISSNVERYIVLIDALDYDHRLVKDQYINRKAWAPESLDWIWGSEFVTWLSSPEPIFWISGKPGSGKSTLTSYIAHSRHLTDRLEDAAAPSSKFLVLLHFFNYQLRQELGNNFAGLLLSLLHSLLDKVPELVPALQKELNLPDSADKAKTWVLNTSQVQSALLWSMRAVVEKGQSLILFIDGLDELDQTHQWELSRFIQELKHFEPGMVKICLSSRNIPPFSDILMAYPTLLISERNHLGIQSWAEQSLNLLQGITDAKSLARKIAARSEGVFVWAHFVLEEALRLVSEGHGRDQEKMEAMLLDQPQELKDIYTRIIRRIREEDRTAAGVYFSLIFGWKVVEYFPPSDDNSHRPLSSFYEASILAIQSFTPPRTHPPHHSHRSRTRLNDHHKVKERIIGEADLKDFRRQLSSISCGMIVTTSLSIRRRHRVEYFSGQWTVFEVHCVDVSAMHRTVQEYFDSGTGWQDLFGDGVDVQRWTYEPWVRACFAFLRAPLTWSHDAAPAAPAVDDWEWSNSDDDDMPKYDLKLEIVQQSLTNYLSSNLGNHVFEYEEAMGRSSKSFAYDVSFDEYLEAHRGNLWVSTFNHYYCSNPPPKMTWELKVRSDIKFAISHGLVRYIQDYLEYLDEAEMMSVQDIFTFAAHCSIADLEYREIRRRQTEVLHFLVEYAKRKNKPLQPLDGFTMYQVLRFGPVETIEICLETFPKGPIVLRPPYFEGCKCMFASDHQSCKIIFYTDRQPVEYTPFHPLARSISEYEKIKLITQLLLERGENIKALCGPEGNVVHAELEFHASALLNAYLPFFWKPLHTDLWMKFGADLHGENSEGLNPLEFFWKRVSEAEISGTDYINWEQIQKIRKVISFLLELGAVNRKKDANGKIPDVETMKNFGNDLIAELRGSFEESSVESLIESLESGIYTEHGSVFH